MTCAIPPAPRLRTKIAAMPATIDVSPANAPLVPSASTCPDSRTWLRNVPTPWPFTSSGESLSAPRRRRRLIGGAASARGGGAGGDAGGGQRHDGEDGQQPEREGRVERAGVERHQAEDPPGEDVERHLGGVQRDEGERFLQQAGLAHDCARVLETRADEPERSDRRVADELGEHGRARTFAPPAGDAAEREHAVDVR